MFLTWIKHYVSGIRIGLQAPMQYEYCKYDTTKKKITYNTYLGTKVLLFLRAYYLNHSYLVGKKNCKCPYFSIYRAWLTDLLPKLISMTYGQHHWFRNKTTFIICMEYMLHSCIDCFFINFMIGSCLDFLLIEVEKKIKSLHHIYSTVQTF